jgi:hypothetical protein
MHNDALHQQDTVASPIDRFTLQNHLDAKLLDAVKVGGTAAVANLLKAGAAVCATCGKCGDASYAAASIIILKCALKRAWKPCTALATWSCLSARRSVLQHPAQPLWQLSAALQKAIST